MNTKIVTSIFKHFTQIENNFLRKSVHFVAIFAMLLDSHVCKTIFCLLVGNYLLMGKYWNPKNYLTNSHLNYIFQANNNIWHEFSSKYSILYSTQLKKICISGW